jgi:3-methyl-2-oxobutanoate hydroxymethyltransferase
MSAQTRSSRLGVPDIMACKNNRKLVCLTANTTPMAALADPFCDLLLVGDSLGMVLHGLPTTLGVTLDMMILHGQAVMRGSQQALVVVDLPFGSYERSPEQAHEAAARVMKETGCQAIKGEAMVPTIAFLAARGIPVVGHVGLRPQAVNSEGGFRSKGKTQGERMRILSEAQAVAEAGAFALVVEAVSPDLAEAITKAVLIPTIGIGASSQCDGQILVTEDMLGLFERTPRFVRRYAELRSTIAEAISHYAQDVRASHFPAEAELYKRQGD